MYLQIIGVVHWHGQSRGLPESGARPAADSSIWHTGHLPQSQIVDFIRLPEQDRLACGLQPHLSEQPGPLHSQRSGGKRQSALIAESRYPRRYPPHDRRGTVFFGGPVTGHCKEVEGSGRSVRQADGQTFNLAVAAEQIRHPERSAPAVRRTQSKDPEAAQCRNRAQRVSRTKWSGSQRWQTLLSAFPLLSASVCCIASARVLDCDSPLS